MTSLRTPVVLQQPDKCMQGDGNSSRVKLTRLMLSTAFAFSSNAYELFEM